MQTASSLATVRDQLTRLQAAVSGLADEHGDTLGMRRLTSDLRRVGEDLDELGPPSMTHVPRTRVEFLEISDTPYDRSMWADAEDEGLGAPDRHAP